MSTFVPATGPVPSDLMIIADAPNAEDQAKHRFFSGKSGAELDRFMDGYRIPRREEWYQTGFFHIAPLKPKEPTPEEIAEAIPYFEDELRRVQPEFIVSMSKRATAYFLGDTYTVDDLHGIPQRSAKTSALVIPAYNPMHALISPETYARSVKDMNTLSQVLRGTYEPPPSDDGVGDYRILTGVEVSEFLGEWDGPIDVDTEGSVARPWSIQITLWPGHGMLVMPADSDGLERLRAHIERYRNLIVFHHAIHDIAVSRAMGIDIVEMDIPFTDTMIKAYLLGEHQALKTLGLRIAGMEQPDFMELLAGPADDVARRWLGDLAWSGRFERHYGPKPPEIEKALRLIERMLMNDAKTPIRDRWEDCRAREVLVDELMLVDEDEMPQPTLDMIDLPIAVRYAGRDTDLTCRVDSALDEQITEYGLELPLQLDLGIVPIVERMTAVGMQVDMHYLKDLSCVLKSEYKLTLERIYEKAGREINPNSGPQIAEWLFTDMNMPWSKKTKKGDRPSTDKKVLEALSKNYEIDYARRSCVDLILEAREIQKVESTYCSRIGEFVGADGRLHPTLLLTRTGTGRTAAKNPNILAFPKWSKRGKLIRGGFIAGKGRKLAEWDLSQIELRVLAIESGDVLMLEQFASGHDFHTAGAAKRYGIPVEELAARVARKEPDALAKRFSQKAINFGIVMGITEHGLFDQFQKAGHTDVTLDDCVDMLTAWAAMYPQAAAYQKAKHAEARRTGCVRTWSGRMRYLEGVHSIDKYAKAEALRQAQATPIQGGARDIMKMWMALVWEGVRKLRARGHWVEAILDVHDSLLLEFDEAIYEELDQLMHSTLASLQRWPIPVICDGSKPKDSWAEV